ncbi:MAG: hypothetical protein HPY94_01875 [Clostridia bacterium]|nr:hypothetical protein [Clostridia bacterium]
MRRNFTNERDFLNTVEQDRCAPSCCLPPPRPKPPPKPDTGFDCCCRTENCKVKFSTDPCSDSIEIKCRKQQDICSCEQKPRCHHERKPPFFPFGNFFH